ncbi:hypothetical protein BamMEX5DRAFT_5101 [Burkholderia ambifaria MEX-5]|uniref:Uncharacterized protein n=1 Tax=Burkholderia ambifaria MEX-5 TaxID=396597 RepID=B1TBD5_9BURK|nr:hypothetical protein BamMEX5DRAFT_5101 [Burkholderia ambifaria MEX-5]
MAERGRRVPACAQMRPVISYSSGKARTMPMVAGSAGQLAGAARAGRMTIG